MDNEECAVDGDYTDAVENKGDYAVTGVSDGDNVVVWVDRWYYADVGLI